MSQCVRLADSQAGCRVFVFSCRTRATEGEAWVPVQSGWQALPRSQVTPAATVWSNKVDLPAARGSQRMRLVMGELEVLPADDSASGTAMVLGGLTGATGTRPVYSDVFEI